MNVVTVNVYCDESSHLLHDLSPSMALGGVWCDSAEVPALSLELRQLKARHGLSKAYEAKWTKVSVGQLAFYLDAVRFFFDNPDLHFRGVLIPDKAALRHEAFDQSHDDWYYKMYYVLLKYLPAHLPREETFAVYLDIKDSHSPQRARHLQDVLCNGIHDFGHERILRVQPVRSHEVELLQLADIFIGAMCASERGTTTSAPKLALMGEIEKFAGQGVTLTTGHQSKFNLLRWQAQGA